MPTTVGIYMNAEHYKVALSGDEGINEWRNRHPDETLDLSNAVFSSLTLFNTDISGANMAKVAVQSTFISETNCSKLDFTEGDITGMVTHNVDFSHSVLSKVNLLGAVFFKADLSNSLINNAQILSSNFFKCNFANDVMAKTELMVTSFKQSDFSSVNLSGATISGSMFSSINLRGTTFSDSVIWDNVFSMCDFSTCKGLESITHKSPSFVDIGSIMLTLRGSGNCLTPEFSNFLLNCGIAPGLLNSIPKILSSIKFYSCFVSYGEPDKAFAEKLRSDLISRGVSCWLYSLDSTPGKATWPEITKNRKEADKMVVICSLKSLSRDGVKKEIEEQIDEDEAKLIPISLDDYWKNDGFEVKRGQANLKPFLLKRNYADFSDPSKYDQAFTRLLKGLMLEPVS